LPDSVGALAAGVARVTMLETTAAASQLLLGSIKIPSNSGTGRGFLIGRQAFHS
jgi:hypothetical protein